jgi:hypothetical protein
MPFRRQRASASSWGRTRAARLYAELLRLRSILQDDTPTGGKAGAGPAQSARGPDQRPPK